MTNNDEIITKQMYSSIHRLKQKKLFMTKSNVIKDINKYDIKYLFKYLLASSSNRSLCRASLRAIVRLNSQLLTSCPVSRQYEHGLE